MLVGPVVILGILGTMIWGFFQPQAAAVTFTIIFIVLFQGYLLALHFIDRRSGPRAFAEPYRFTFEEVETVKRYPFFFRSPLLARACSSALSMIGLTSFVWTPWLLYNAEWGLAVIIGLNYFVSGPISLKLNPLPFLQRGAATGTNAFAESELELVNSAIEKIQNEREAKAA